MGGGEGSEAVGVGVVTVVVLKAINNNPIMAIIPVFIYILPFDLLLFGCFFLSLPVGGGGAGDIGFLDFL